MIVIEEQSHENAIWHGDQDPLDIDVPEVDNPGPVDGWIEGARDGEKFEVEV